ncbi:unnamed protein product [Fraxinus pennsylvanica]|uniref:Uncharacterized protein n=1 Tax=Fraxinus pennsylvanica TaxID=56036 RepID=A0AAD2A7Q7_9LAMI|nr:unnamed protein product [Fraxinus pennsylvanica]
MQLDTAREEEEEPQEEEEEEEEEPAAVLPELQRVSFLELCQRHRGENSVSHVSLVEEDRDPAGFLGSDITIDAAREAMRSIWQNDEENGNDTGSLAQSETSVTDVMFSDSIKCILGLQLSSRIIPHGLRRP